MEFLTSDLFNQRAGEHLLVDRDVLFGDFLVVELDQAFAHDTADLAVADFLRQRVENHRLLHRPAQRIRAIVVKAETIASGKLYVEWADGVVESARGVNDRQRPVDRRSHLRESAGFKQRRHQHVIRAGIGESRKPFIEVRDGHPVLEVEGINDVVEMVFVGAVGDDDHLQVAVPVVGDDLEKDVGDELRSLLHWIEPGGPEEDRGVGILGELQFALQSQLVGGFASTEIVMGKISDQRVIGAGLYEGSGALRMPAEQLAANLWRSSARTGSGTTECQPSTISQRKRGLTVLMKWAAKMPEASISTGTCERACS